MNGLPDTAVRRITVPTYALFAAFGTFWGTWGAAVPRVRLQSGVSDAELGTALLFVGAGALPAMLLTGRAVDRWGGAVAGVATGALGAAGLAVAAFAHDLPSLCLALTLVGLASGAADVAINALAGRAEQLLSRPVITRAHGVFSSAVVLSSLLAGLLAARGADAFVAFASPALCCVAAGLLAVRSAPSTRSAQSAQALESVSERLERGGPVRPGLVPILLPIGLAAALAFAIENAHQSWGALFLEDELGSGVGLSAIAPAIFAASVAATRFAAGNLRPESARAVIRIGSIAAVIGTAMLARSSSVPMGVAGLAIAGAGTAVLFPTLVGMASRRVDDARRGRAVSIVTMVGYVGFLLGPVYVGRLAEGLGLRGAMLGVAALALASSLLSMSTLGEAGARGRSRPR